MSNWKHPIEGCAENCPFFFEDNFWSENKIVTPLCCHPAMESEREIPTTETEDSITEIPSWCELRKASTLVELEET